jgi:hypothetical protein
MKFKVGDRVRIDYPDSWAHGKEGTIWFINPNTDIYDMHDRPTRNVTAYRVDVDGVGTRSLVGSGYIAYEAHELKPTQPLGSWDEITRMVGKDIRQPKEVTC